METPIFISFLQNIHLVGSDVDLERHHVNKQLYLYHMLYGIRFIYPEHRASTEGGYPKIYTHLVDIVSKEYYYDVYNHKSNEIPITTCLNGSCTYGFAKGKPFITATIECYKDRYCSENLSIKIHHPEDGEYQDVTFLDPELYHNPEIIKTMMFYNKLL